MSQRAGSLPRASLAFAALVCRAHSTQLLFKRGQCYRSRYFKSPSALAADLNNPVLFISIWLVGAAVAALGANCVAGLAVLLPKAGAHISTSTAPLENILAFRWAG